MPGSGWRRRWRGHSHRLSTAYEQDPATIFSDLTVNARASFVIGSLAIVSFPIASIFPCAADPVMDTLWPRCLLRSTDELATVRVVGAMAALLIVSWAIVSFFMASLPMRLAATCVSTNAPAAVPASMQPV